MKKGISHIVFFVFMSLFALDGNSQGDSIACDSSILIHIDCNPMLDGMPLKTGDVISLNSVGVDQSIDGESLIYSPDTSNTLSLVSQGSFIAAIIQDSLRFNVHSATSMCNSNLILYTVDTENSSSCFMRITSFEATSYSISYPITELCIGTDTIFPYIDLDFGELTFVSEPEGLDIDRHGFIVSDYSTPGVYTLTVESDYCLSQNQFEITIFEGLPLDLKDTLYVCEGSFISNDGTDLRDFIFYDGTIELNPLDETFESGYYIAEINQDQCIGMDSVYLEITESPDVDLIQEQECDRVILHTEIHSGGTNVVTWADSTMGETFEVFEDTNLFVKVVNEYGCAWYDSLFIDVNILEVASAEYLKEEAECWNEGSVEITASNVNNNIGDIEYRLRNTLTGQLFTSLNEVPEGVYQLQVVDNRDCIATYEEEITVIQKCNEEYPVFTPDGDSVEDEYFIPHEGSVKIYNRDGNLLKELVTPAYWDGNSDTGNPLPMGNYFIVTDEGKVVNITIVK